MRLHIREDYNPNGFAVTGYLSTGRRGAYADRYFDPNEWSEIESYAHDLLMRGLYVNITDFKTGDMIDIDPDEYINNFDGDFVINSEIDNFKNKALHGNFRENIQWDTDLPLYVGDLFVDNRGNTVKIIKINEKDVTIRNMNSNIISRMRKDYLCNNFKLVTDEEDFEECFAAKTSYMEKISDKDYSQSKKGKAYKVFQFKDGKLYPPMVANPGGGDTPVGVWLDAEPGEFVEIDGLQRVVQRGVKGDKLRQRVANLDKLSPEDRKAEIKKIKSSTLAYRPGWHLGDEPRASQFDREASWEILDELPEGAKVAGNVTNENTLAKKGTPGNIGKYFLIKSTGKYAHIIGGNGQVFFPYNFVWAECEYIMDIDYQDEAMSYGYRKGKKFQHSLAGLPRVPEGGAYKYRTNPNPDTVPWVITGAIKVTKLLDDFDVRKILGNSAPERQGGDKTLSEMGLKQI